jgi:hypothetical protein
VLSFIEPNSRPTYFGQFIFSFLHNNIQY